MTYLFLSILCSVAVANLLKLFSKDKSSSSLYIFLGNYLAAFVLGFLLIPRSGAEVRATDIAISSLSGLFFLAGFIFYLKNITVNGLSISVSTFRMSLVIPVAGSMLLFGEKLSPVNYAGIAMIIASFGLMGSEKKKYRILFLIILFFIAGCADFFPKFYTKYNHHNPDSLYLSLNFAFAFIFNLFFILFKRTPPSLSSFLFGMILGLPNFFTAFFLMKSFNFVSGTIAYPILSSSTVALTMLSDYLFWGKRFTRKEYIIFGLVILGLVLTVVSF